MSSRLTPFLYNELEKLKRCNDSNNPCTLTFLDFKHLDQISATSSVFSELSHTLVCIQILHVDAVDDNWGRLKVTDGRHTFTMLIPATDLVLIRGRQKRKDYKFLTNALITCAVKVAAEFQSRESDYSTSPQACFYPLVLGYSSRWVSAFIKPLIKNDNYLQLDSSIIIKKMSTDPSAENMNNRSIHDIRENRHNSQLLVGTYNSILFNSPSSFIKRPNEILDSSRTHETSYEMQKTPLKRSTHPAQSPAGTGDATHDRTPSRDVLSHEMLTVLDGSLKHPRHSHDIPDDFTSPLKNGFKTPSRQRQNMHFGSPSDHQLIKSTPRRTKRFKPIPPPSAKITPPTKFHSDESNMLIKSSDGSYPYSRTTEFDETSYLVGLRDSLISSKPSDVSSDRSSEKLVHSNKHSSTSMKEPLTTAQTIDVDFYTNLRETLDSRGDLVYPAPLQDDESKHSSFDEGEYYCRLRSSMLAPAPHKAAPFRGRSVPLRDEPILTLELERYPFEQPSTQEESSMEAVTGSTNSAMSSNSLFQIKVRSEESDSIDSIASVKQLNGSSVQEIKDCSGQSSDELRFNNGCQKIFHSDITRDNHHGTYSPLSSLDEIEMSHQSDLSSIPLPSFNNVSQSSVKPTGSAQRDSELIICSSPEIGECFSSSDEFYSANEG